MSGDDKGIEIDLKLPKRDISISEMMPKREEVSPHLIPPDWEVEPESIGQLEQLLAAWEDQASPGEQKMAAKLVTGACQRIEWFTARERAEKIGALQNARAVRDAVISGAPNAEELVWETTTQRGLARLRKEVPFNANFSSFGRSLQRSVVGAERSLKNSQDQISQDDLVRITADCMMAYVQSEQNPKVAERVVQVVEGVGRRLGQPQDTDRLRKAIPLFDTAIAPIRKTVLYQTNRAIGPMSTSK